MRKLRTREEEPMATQELTLDLPAPHEADVAASQGGTRWSVAECGWKKLLPDLPDDVIALLATPVVVSTQTLEAVALEAVALEAETLDRVADEPDEPEERYPSPLEPCATTRTGYGECTPHFLAPAPPRNRRPRHRI
ncbi:MAG: hypothetical protein AUI14_22975 [Actinobacteria bacterium 13_2_20CM_2_71_6]|nr:MAG: hypothetical protein AUI14_22975 [Actinobacteria bacterium 13_2_20CM_2_71_6]